MHVDQHILVPIISILASFPFTLLHLHYVPSLFCLPNVVELTCISDSLALAGFATLCSALKECSLY